MPSADMDATPVLIKVVSSTGPPSLGRLESLRKKTLTAIPSNQPHQLMNTFHLSCDQNYFRTTLLITTQVVFLKNKQTNKAISMFNSQQPRIR